MENPAQDKIRLLMEETGCDQGQAELALSSADFDVEKAVRTIGVLLRNIVAVRGKFFMPSQNIYGLLLLVADVKRWTLLRTRAVVSYNPLLFETPVGLDWYEFERSVYGFRLSEGTLQQVTQDLERDLVERVEDMAGTSFYEVLRAGPDEALVEHLQTLLRANFPGEAVSVSLCREELNLDQYRRLKGAFPVDAPSASPSETGAKGQMQVAVSLEQSATGEPAKLIKPGDSVYALITDERDIAQYLSKLLGGRIGENFNSLAVPVESVEQREGMVAFRIRLSMGIMGLAEVEENSLLRVQKKASDPWWRRLFK